MILAGIDIGTNATRLLIADTTATSHRTVFAARTITRLGQDLDRTGELSRDARERTLRALASFQSQIAHYAVTDTAVVGTSALRRAANAPDFVQEVLERTGLRLQVISGKEEARLTLEGVRRALSPRSSPAGDPLRNALVADIGGGSTELIVTSEGEVLTDTSLELGAVYLTERYLSGDPPALEEVRSLRNDVRSALSSWKRTQIPQQRGSASSIDLLAGTAGTVTTLAAMDQALMRYDPAMINGYAFSRSSLDRLVEQLSRASRRERRTMPGLEPGREDIILAGAVITQELMEIIGRKTMLVSDWGLREGVVIDLFQRCSAQRS